MSKYERTKLWIKKNRDPIAAVVIVVSFVGVMIAAVKADIHYQEQQKIHLNGYIDELNALHHDNEMLNELNELLLLEESEK